MDLSEMNVILQKSDTASMRKKTDRPTSDDVDEQEGSDEAEDEDAAAKDDTNTPNPKSASPKPTQRKGRGKSSLEADEVSLLLLLISRYFIFIAKFSSSFYVICGTICDRQ
jgi:hypothetical protein